MMPVPSNCSGVRGLLVLLQQSYPVRFFLKPLERSTPLVDAVAIGHVHSYVVRYRELPTYLARIAGPSLSRHPVGYARHVQRHRLRMYGICCC